jgi:hypothetical protein
MGRILNDGSFKPKPSIQKQLEWMQQRPQPMQVFRKGTTVKVFMGAGWATGKVEESSTTSCIVYIKMGNKRVTVYDRRNIKETSA